MTEDANRASGFWQSTLGQSLYNGVATDQGDANGDGTPDGDMDFDEEGWCEEDLLLTFGFDMPEGEFAYPGKGAPGDNNLSNASHANLPDADDIPDHFLIWDQNGDGYVPGTDDIALTFEELLDWVDGGDGKGQRDFINVLQQDVAAAYLNTLNNTCLAGSHDDPVFDPEITDAYADAFDFILYVSGGRKQQLEAWEDFGNDAHIWLAAFNENGQAVVESELTQILMDGDDYSNDILQNYLALEDAFDFLV